MVAWPVVPGRASAQDLEPHTGKPPGGLGGRSRASHTALEAAECGFWWLQWLLRFLPGKA